MPIETKLERLSTATVGDIYEQIGQLDTGQSALEERVEGVTDAAAEQRAIIEGVNTRMAGLQTTLAQIVDSNPDVETDMASLQDRNNEVWSKLLELQFSISAVSARVTAGTDDAGTRLDALERSVPPIRNDLRQLANITVPRMRQDVTALRSNQLETGNRMVELELDVTQQIREVGQVRADVNALETTLATLLQNNPNVDANLDALQRRNSEIYTDLNRFRRNMTQLGARYDVLHQNVVLMSTQVNALQNETRGVRASVSGLRDELRPLVQDEIGARVDTLTRDVTQLRRNVSGVVQGLGSVQRDAAGNHDDTAEIRTQVTALETTLGQILENNPDLHSNMEEIQTRNNEIFRDLSSLRTNMTLLQMNVTAVNVDVGSLGNRVSSLQGQVSDVSSAVAPLRSDLSALSNAVSSHQEFTEIADGRLNLMQSRYNRLDANLTDVWRNLSGVARHFRRIERDLAGVADLNTTWATTLTQSSTVGSQELGVVRGDVERLERVLTQFSGFYDTEIADVKTTTSELETSVGTLRDDVETLQTDARNLGAEDARVNARISDMAARGDETLRAVSRAQLGVSTHDTKIAELTRDMTSVNARVLALTNQNNAQQETLRDNENALSGLRSQSEAAQTRLASIETTLATINTEIDAILADDLVTSTELSELQQNLTTLNELYNDLDIEVEELFKINKTELIRQLNVPIEALVEIVDDIVRTSNQNFRDVQQNLDGLERNMTLQYEEVMTWLRDSGFVIERITDAEGGNQGEPGASQGGPQGPSSGGPRPPAMPPAPPGSRDGPGPPAPPAPPPSGPSGTGSEVVQAIRNNLSALTARVNSMQTTLRSKADRAEVTSLRQEVTELRRNVTWVSTSVGSVGSSLGEIPRA